MINGDIKISKKGVLAIVATIGIYAMADFVGIANVKGSGGINIVGDTVEDSIAAIMPVGSVVLRIDNINPTDIYGGTWELITGDASLRLGDGGTLTGTVDSGNNDPLVPLKNHTHSIEHNHPNTTTSSNGSHRHALNGGTAGGSNQILGTQSSRVMGITDAASGYHFAEGGTYLMSSEGSHQHNVDLPNFSGTSGSASNNDGTDPTIDVRGASVKVNVWKRTN